MGRRRRVRLITAVAAAAIAALAAGGFPLITYNRSPSVPVGWYYVKPAPGTPIRGRLVVIEPPPALRALLVARGYLGRKATLIKVVAAISGDTVCRHGLTVTINGTRRATALETDSHGRPLPAWQGCHQLAEGEFFPLATDIPNSFDGRYFGPLPVAVIAGEAIGLF